jgi:hypothetical protein
MVLILISGFHKPPATLGRFSWVCLVKTRPYNATQKIIEILNSYKYRNHVLCGKKSMSVS